MSTILSPGMTVSTKKWPRWWLHPRFWGTPKSGTVLSWSDPRVKALVGEKERYDKEAFIPVAWDSGVVTLEPRRSLRPYEQVKKKWEKARLEHVNGGFYGYADGAFIATFVAVNLYLLTLTFAYHGLLPGTADPWRLVAFITITTILSGTLSIELVHVLLGAILFLVFLIDMLTLPFYVNNTIDLVRSLF